MKEMFKTALILTLISSMICLPLFVRDLSSVRYLIGSKDLYLKEVFGLTMRFVLRAILVTPSVVLVLYFFGFIQIERSEKRVEISS